MSANYVNRAEYLVWCKQRAIEYVDAGDLANAHASINSDLSRHPETVGHMAINFGMLLAMRGLLSTKQQMREWIEGIT